MRERGKHHGPRMPEWDANEILRFVADNYSSRTERYSRLGLDESELVREASRLEPSQEDKERWTEEIAADLERCDRYNGKSWHKSFEDGDVHFKVLYEPGNAEGYIKYTVDER